MLLTASTNVQYNRFGQALLHVKSDYVCFVFRLEPIFASASAASKNATHSKAVKRDSKIIVLLSLRLCMKCLLTVAFKKFIAIYSRSQKDYF